MALVGQVSTHWQHSTQSSGLTAADFPSTISNTPVGQASMQRPSPTHRSMSTSMVTPLALLSYIFVAKSSPDMHVASCQIYRLP